MKGILGTKLEMKRLFSTNGKEIRSTVIKIDPNFVSQVKTVAKDKYNALQLSTCDLRLNLSNKPLKGHFGKNGIKPQRFIKEIRGMEGFNNGDIITGEDVFKVGDFVDVTGTSKGKGFQGRVKRFNQSRGPMGHGSGLHRQMGSTGSINANRVFKAQPMPGHMGNVQRTMSNLEIIEVKKHYLIVKGSVPGPKEGLLVVKSAIKKSKSLTPVKLHRWNNASTIVETNIKDQVE